MPRSQHEIQFQSPGLQRSTDPNTFLSEVKYMIDLCDLQETIIINLHFLTQLLRMVFSRMSKYNFVIKDCPQSSKFQ